MSELNEARIVLAVIILITVSRILATTPSMEEPGEIWYTGGTVTYSNPIEDDVRGLLRLIRDIRYELDCIDNPEYQEYSIKLKADRIKRRDELINKADILLKEWELRLGKL